MADKNPHGPDCPTLTEPDAECTCSGIANKYWLNPDPRRTKRDRRSSFVADMIPIIEILGSPPQAGEKLEEQILRAVVALCPPKAKA